MKSKTLLLFVFITLCSTLLAQEPLEVFSPNKELKAQIQLREKIYYTVFYKDERVLQASPLTLTIDKEILGKNPKLKKSEMQGIREEINTVWGSRKVIKDNYNELTLNFENDFSVVFRVYDYGIAYRFETNKKKEQVIVNTEEVAFRFNFGVSAWLPTRQSYETNYEKTILDVENIQNFNNDIDNIFLPIMVNATSDTKVLITEAGLYDYPSLFLDRGNDYENFLNGKFEKYALTTKVGGFSNYSRLTDKEAEYIAITKGKRAYPWRLLIISDDDRTFLDCDLVFQLSEPNKVDDTSWIKPGKVAWEWWHDYVIEGKDFVGGVNTETYLYHIDFAAKYGLEYLLIDWLWTDKYDLTLFNPDVDIKKIVEYANKKNVKMIVWCPGHTLHKQLDKVLDLFASYGIAGVKADFFDREDQTGIKMYEDIAKATAKRKMLIDFHGATKPTGLSRTYPNVINYEAVAGNEWNKLSEDLTTIKHKVVMPFIRGQQGPMDYTPGGMRNVQSGHNLRFTLPLVHGTRANEMALFVLYNEPLKMLCDAPSVYDREEQLTHFIAKIPTTWDDTKVLEAELGEYIVTARKTGKTWYVAGITGDSAKEILVDFSFLEEGNYKATILKDGPNGNRVGTDYLFKEETVSNRYKYSILMQNGGGFVIQLSKLN